MIYVGNSYGSELGVYIAATYPDLFNMSIFTGYTKRVLPAYAGILLQDPQPASVVFPERFSNVTSPFYVRLEHDSSLPRHPALHLAAVLSCSRSCSCASDQRY